MGLTSFVLTRQVTSQREVLIFAASPMHEAMWLPWTPGVACPPEALRADRPRMEKWQKTFAYPTRVEAAK